MTVLLTGAAGQLGRELLPRLTARGAVIAVDRASVPGDRHMVVQDLGDLGGVETLLNRTRPDLVVNAAAYTAVDLAEDNEDLAFLVNQGLPERLAHWCRRNDRALVHYSTDYVFDGKSGRPYREDDKTGPLGVYGRSKLAGEEAIARAACRHVILRTSWVYSGHGNNFLLTMLNLARNRPSLTIVDDQRGRPTWARNLAAVTDQLLDRVTGGTGARKVNGVYHYCDGDEVSWFEFANRIFGIAQESGLLENAPATHPVPSEEFPQKAERPLYSVLDTRRIEQECSVVPAGLDTSLRSCIGDIVENE